MKDFYKYQDLYKVFNKGLIELVDIDWFEMQKVYKEIGNTPGIYADTALFFCKLVKSSFAKKVLEFGSGASSLFLAKACNLFGKEFKSYEEQPNYLDKTRKLLLHYGLNEKQVSLFKDIDDVDCNVDFAFIDSSKPLRKYLLSSNKLRKTSLVVVDDVGDPELAPFCTRFMSTFSRSTFYVYNGVGRKNRLQFMNYLPDVINIRHFVSSEMPCLGVWIGGEE